VPCLHEAAKFLRLSVWVSALCFSQVHAFELTPYIDLSSSDKPQGNAGISFRDDGLRLGASLKIKGDGGSAGAHPRLSSSFEIGEKLDIETNFNLPDWSRGIDFSQSSIDTKLRFRSPAPFVRRLDVNVKQVAGGVSHDSFIYFRSPTPFIKQLEGRVRRSTNGVSRYSMNLAFAEQLSEENAENPFSVSGRATLEQTDRPNKPGTLRIGMETVITGLVPRDFGGLLSRWRSTSSNKLVLRFERQTGRQTSFTSTIAYDHAWRIRQATDIELSLKLNRTTERQFASLDVTWQAKF
jgi:hypothetical protein